MPRPNHTRRQALAIGAAALAATGLRPGRAQAAGPDAFELVLPAQDGRALAAAAGWRTTGVLRAPHRFDLAGVRWAAGDLEVQLRARRRGGRWTRWTPLHGAGDHAPDAGRAATGTEPAWTGPADLLQLRLRGRARGIRVRFVHAAPAVPRRRAAAASRRLTGAPRRRQVPLIIPRAGWGGDLVPPRSGPAYGQVQIAFVHHTATATDYAPEDSAAMVLGIARYHRDTNGWNDVGYNFLVDRFGQVFEGRAGGVDQAIVGAQAQGWNSVSTGIACLGTFTDVLQSEEALDALAELIGWKLSLHGVPVLGQVTAVSAGGETNRYPAGAQIVFERISGHRDGNASACPGDALYAQLPELRARAASYAGPVAGLSIRASTDTVRGEAPVLLSGFLRFADGSPAAGAPVEILFSATASSFQLVASAVCAADGGWTASVVLPRGGSLYARFPGDATRPAADSPRTTITVVPRLSVRLSARRVPRGRRVRVTGEVAPAAPRATVVVERAGRGGWVRVGRRRVLLRAGRLDTRVPLGRRGRHRVTVTVPGAAKARWVRAV